MFGRDIADRLSHQKIIHERLCSSVRVPLALDLFQNRHNTYLAIEYISGRDFSTEIPFDWRGRSRADRVRLLRAFENISAAIARFHAEGYVHRDLKPSNIRVGKQGQIWLIDLELAYQLVDGGTPFQQGTPGYMSPQQQRGEAPIAGDDVYSLGATFFHVLSGLHPNSFAFDVEHGALLRASDLLYFLPADLIELIVACCSPAPEKRPSAKVVRKRLQVVRRALCEARDQPSGHPFPLSCPSQSTLKEALAACCHGLASDVMLDSRSGVWMSHSLERPGSYEHLISANRGAAGALYVAARLSRQDLSNALLSARARTTAEWLLSCPDTSDSGLPGLHFGRAGCAVAIAEAVRGGIIEGGTTVQTYIRESLGGVLDWPDLTHGAAGQGIAAMYCADCLGNEDWAVLAAPCARYLVDSQRSDGSWEMPTGVDVLTGEVFSGFAHGVAGIVYFLSAYSHRFGDKSVETSWTRGADWLILNSVSSRANSQLAWTWSLQNESVWNWWCHGAPGIALTFLSLYGASGNERFATVARQALQSVPEGIRSGSLGQCHGLAGIGEIFLEAARTLAEPFWKDRSLDIANTIMQLARSTPEGTCTWKVDDAPFPTADLMVGNGGIAHFLMRAIKYEESIGFPLLLGASPR